jgi:uncharacterized protein YbgA (DUF1722 family)
MAIRIGISSRLLGETAISRRCSIAANRPQLTGAIEGYRTGLVPLVVPMTLLRHHV